jgi:D-alanyl-D-alanine carboxypeptidase
MMRSAFDQRLFTIVQQPERPLASLAVVVVVDNQIVHECSLGNRWIDPLDPARSLPLTSETSFRVASISKLVTALAVMQLVERGLVELDRDVGDYLGFALRNPHFPATPITTRMLLSHTSSLRDGDLYTAALPDLLEDFFSPAGALYAHGAHFAAPQPGQDVTPGRFFCYANLNCGVLATIVERVTGQRFDLYVHDHILRPLEIDGGFNVNLLSDRAFQQIATLYRRQQWGVWSLDGPWAPQVDDYRGVRPASPAPVRAPCTLDEYRVGTNGTLFSPQGGLRISARDLVKIMQLFMNGGRCGDVQIVQPATLTQMLSVQWRYDADAANGDPYGGLMRAWGLGPQRTTAHHDGARGAAGSGDRHAADSTLQLWGHAGDAYGLLGGLWCDPAQRRGFIYIIGGVGADPETQRGRYSSFFRWEEEIQTAMVEEFFAV